MRTGGDFNFLEAMMRLPHFALQLELGRFMATLGIIDDVDESDEVAILDGSSPDPIDGYPSDGFIAPEEHEVPLGFHVRGGGYDEEDA